MTKKTFNLTSGGHSLEPPFARLFLERLARLERAQRRKIGELTPLGWSAGLLEERGNFGQTEGGRLEMLRNWT